MASSFEVTDRGHSKVLLHELNEQRIQGIFCDVTIVVQDSKFKAHKNILAAFSRYFKELLANQSLWVMDPVLELREMKAEIFAKILNFIYSSRVVIERLEEANDLASAGHRLGIHLLKDLLEVSSQTRACNDRLTPPSAQSSLSQLSDFPQIPQGPKEDNQDCTGGESFEDDIAPLRLWPANSLFTSKALAGPSLPIDLTATTSWRPSDAERPAPPPPPPPPPTYHPQTPSSRPESTGSHLLERSSTVSSEPEDGGTPLCPDGDESCAEEGTQLSDLFQADFLKGPTQDPTEEANEAAKRLYTLSTVAFRGLGFNVEDSANSGVPPAKEPAVALAGPDTTWAPPPVGGSPEEEVVESARATSADAAATADYPPSLLPCGLCTRSFSTPSALSLHGKLHRAGRALSCRYCHKPFIHVKRLHTHQMLCRRADRAPSPHSPSPPHHLAAAAAAAAGGLPSPDDPGADSAQPPEPTPADGGAGKARALPRMDVLTEEEHFMKVVDGHLLYFCAVCERSYVTLSSLKRHANVHSWRRKYPCRYCDKVFALAEYRTKHEVWHTGERRYQCIFCWETFVTYYNLKTHQKSFHGVDPGLTISQKTPNGGYKPKLNAFKLYRLLPMRSQKRPYKTYSHSVSDELLNYAQNVPLSLPTDDPPSNDLTALPRASPAKYAQEESQAAGSQSPKGPATPPAQDPLRGPADRRASPAGSPPPGAHLGGRATPGEGDATLARPPSAFSSSEVAAPVPSVITYGHPASSVIVHSNALLPAIAHRNQSSVIAYNGKCTPGQGAGDPSPACPAKRHTSKDDTQQPERPSSACVATNQRHNHHKEPRGQKPKKHFLPAKGKTMTYVAKPACAGTTSESRGAPLCQITMRIGEEAIVKRRISESDLIRDKGGKGKRCDDPQAGGKRNCKEGPEGEAQQKAEYFLGNESGDEVSDNDTDDNLWRPYYSYKPKKRAGGFHKAKKSGWRRKLRYRHSPRWLQRAAKGPDRELVLEAMDGRSQEPRLDEDSAKEPEDPVRIGCSSCPETFSERPPLRQHRWRDETRRVYACSTCGKEFSALRNLEKHEEAHLVPAEFGCRSCSRVFTLAKTLRKHEKTHSGQKLWPPPPPAPQRPGEAPKPPRHAGGRKPPGCHACAHCSKTCKTAAALARHQKRHRAEERSGAPPALSQAPRQGPDGGSPEPVGQPDGTARVAHRPMPPEGEEDARPAPGGGTGVAELPSTGAGESVEPLQRDDRPPTGPAYARGCAGERSPQGTGMCPPGDAPSISAPDPARPPGAGGGEAPGREAMPPMLILRGGGEPCTADPPEARMPFANGGASEDRAQEVHLPPSREPPLGAGGVRSPAVEPSRDGTCDQDAEEEVSPLPEPGGEARDFHTLEPMVHQEVTGFREGEQGLEAARDSEYPVQEYPIPLITSGNCRSHTELGSKGLAFRPGTIRLKEGHEDLSKVAFYQDPYQLVYGHQLLTSAYPYNFTHVSPLPMALNMVIRDEKGQQLPLLHRMFVYPTPCRDEAAPLPPPPPPPLGAGGNGNRDDAGRELVAGEKGASMY
ncbi:zinc finger and BTB domain-containing protein 4 [Carcharodon carcharias]|uniref:zinc finger and BTB domain-containing protein 4 n=1 Tax=Carcharodon carcharias TaxID=13397 RepID=UPI001B7DEB13|nr:zinc finger and BTB domain-containing protein 4 [Carcharodon carcharias]